MIPEPLRSQLVEALARLVVMDLERFPELPEERDDEGEEANGYHGNPLVAVASRPVGRAQPSGQ